MKYCGNCGTRLPELSTGELIDMAAVPRQFGAMIGADLMERFRKAGLEAAGQRRNVTVLFADLAGFTNLSSQLDNELLYELIQKYIALLADSVYKYEGMVDKFTGDGLMALFGAPISHENNAELAILAALDMKANLSQLSKEMQLEAELHLHIGLHAGSVIVGGIGSDMLMNYTAIGDTVNLAQRLDSAAGAGQILASEAVFQKTKALFDFEEIPNLTLKGYLHPVKAYNVLKTKVRPGSTRGLEGLRAPMIGRDAELRRLMQLISALISYHQGQMALIVGEAGLGKSRLVSEVKSLSQDLPATILEAHSLTYRRSVSYWIFLDLLRSYLHITADTPADEASQKLNQKVAEALDERSAEVLPYLEHILLLPPSDPLAAQRIEYLEADQLRQQIFLAIRDLLVAEAHHQPLVLILEDLHWADEASLSLLDFLIESVQQEPLLIVAVSRPYTEGFLRKIADHAQQALADRFNLITLNTLSASQSTQLLRQLLSVPNLPEALHAQIIQRAAGIPLYLEEILRMLIDQGVLYHQDGRWRFAEGVDLAGLGVPDTLQGLLLTRFDRLNPSQRRILQVASVIGRTFSLAVLQAVLPNIPEGELRQILASLIEREFLVPQVVGQGFEYNFKHILVSDVIYGTLLKRERGELHALVGDAIERIYAERLDEQIDLLARHYSWSPRKDKALHYLILAGQKAARSYINDQARQHFEEAMFLLPQVEHTTDQEYQIFLGLGDILALAGEYPTARERYLRGLDTLACENPADCAEQRSRLKRKIAATYERQGDYDQALACLAEAQRILADSPLPLPVAAAQIANDVGWIHFRRGNLDEAEHHLLQALALTQGTSRYEVIASIYNRLGGVYYQKDQLDIASDYVQKSLALREELGDTVTVARSYNNLGLLDWKRGQWERALQNFQRSFELQANRGDVEGMIELQTNLGLLQLDRGNMEEAKNYLDSALVTAQKIGHPFVIGITYLYFSRLYLSLEDWPAALKAGQRCLEILEGIGDQDHLVDVYVNLGLAHQGLGNLTDASQYCTRAIELFERQGNGKTPTQAENRGRALRFKGDLCRMQGDYLQAQQYLQEAAAIFTAVGNQLEQGRSIVCLALLAKAQGNLTAARVQLNEARLIFRQLGAKQDLRKLETISTQLSPASQRPPTTPRKIS